MWLKKFNFIITLLLILAASACGQKGLTELKDNTELSIAYDRLGKQGGVKKYLVDLKDVPGATELPSAYTRIENKSYYVRIDAIYYGKPVFTFKLPVQNELDFNKIRVLTLSRNSLNPSGYEWIDCSILSQDWINPPADVQPERKEKMLKLVPNYVEKTVSCMTDFKADNYFAAVFQKQDQPKAPISKIDFTLEKTAGSDLTGSTVYTVSVKNTGDKDIGEVNFRSDFDYDFTLTHIKSSQGNCQLAQNRAKGDSDSCYLGGLRAGAITTIEFTGVSAGTQSGEPRTPNLNWEIYGYMKAAPNDPNWPINRFSFNPLHKQ